MDEKSVSRQDFQDGQKTEIIGHTLQGAAAMHGAAFQKKTWELNTLSVEENYDYVVVGSGLSGLSAAYFYRKKFGKDKKILILDSLSDFGGHAKRNEFTYDGNTYLGYGGSESFQSPKANFSETMHGLIKDLGIDLEAFDNKYFQHSLYPKLGLSRGSFFDGSKYTKDTLVTGDPTLWVSDDVKPGNLNERPIEKFIADFPLPPTSKSALIELYTNKDKVTLSNLSDRKAKQEYLDSISYSEFLKKDWNLPEDAISYFSNRTLDFFGLPPSLIPALEAIQFGYPGGQGIDLDPSILENGELSETYIYHFPDGNASFARLILRSLIPSAIQGNSMEDIVLATVKKSELDNADNSVRLRLNSSCIFADNVKDQNKVEVVYTDTITHQLKKISATHCTLACFNMAIPYILRDALPKEQAESLKNNVKVPMIYTNVLVKNWKPWVKLGVHEIYGVGTFHSRIKLDYPVIIGDYKPPLDPEKPILIHMVHVPSIADAQEPRTGLRLARKTLFGKKFEDYEKLIRSDLNKMLGPGGFDATNDIVGIAINRWSHGYSYTINGLAESEEESHKKIKTAKQPVGNITIACSDAAWSAYAHSAVDEAARAVNELK